MEIELQQNFENELGVNMYDNTPDFECTFS